MSAAPQPRQPLQGNPNRTLEAQTNQLRPSERLNAYPCPICKSPLSPVTVDAFAAHIQAEHRMPRQVSRVAALGLMRRYLKDGGAL